MRPKGFKHSDETKRKMRESANGFKKGHITWNKGLSVDDPRVKKYGENGALTRRAKKIAGLSKPNWNKGYTKETDPRMALIAKKVSETKKGVPYAPGHVAWSKGLTKETDPRLSAMAEKVSRTLKMKGHYPKITPETRKKMSESRKGKRWSNRQRLKYTEALNSEDHKKKLPEISAKLAKLWEDPDYRSRASTKTNMSEVAKKNWESEEYRSKLMSIFQSDEWRKETSERFTGWWKDPKRRENRGVEVRNRWADDVYKERVLKSILKSLMKRPTSIESLLDSILKSRFPGMWRYVGNGEVIIGGKNPDFISRDGKKVIEVFGSFWHDEVDEVGRRNHFEERGYPCMVIWDRELQDKDTLIGKLSAFCGQNILVGEEN